MKRVSKILVTALAASLMGSALAAPPTAKAILGAASAKAAKSGKNVLVVFHASWCGWCHKFDDFLATPTGKKVSNGLEIVHVTIMENGDKKALENAGGSELFASLGGAANSGIPFMAIVDPKGKMLINSNYGDKHENMGYPGEPAEIAHFAEMLTKAAPKISVADRAEIIKWLTDHKP